MAVWSLECLRLFCWLEAVPGGCGRAPAQPGPMHPIPGVCGRAPSRSGSLLGVAASRGASGDLAYHVAAAGPAEPRGLRQRGGQSGHVSRRRNGPTRNGKPGGRLSRPPGAPSQGLADRSTSARLPQKDESGVAGCLGRKSYS